MMLDVAMAEALIPLKSLEAAPLWQLLQESETLNVFRGSAVPGAISAGAPTTDFLLSGALQCTDHTGLTQRLDASCCRRALQLGEAITRWQAVVDAQILRVNTERLDQLLTWSQTANYLILSLLEQPEFGEDRLWVSALLRSNLFFKIPPLNLLAVIDSFTARWVDAGEVIIREGELGDCCFFIKEGVALVQRAVAGGALATVVARLEPGQCFGEDALINDAPRNASVVMATSGVLMMLAKNQFLALLKAPVSTGIHASDRQPGDILVDVRTADEFEHSHLPGAINMPLGLLWLQKRQLPAGRRILLCCNSGRRSAAAASLLSNAGFAAVFMAGGLASCH